MMNQQQIQVTVQDRFDLLASFKRRLSVWKDDERLAVKELHDAKCKAEQLAEFTRPKMHVYDKEEAALFEARENLRKANLNINRLKTQLAGTDFQVTVTSSNEFKLLMELRRQGIWVGNAVNISPAMREDERSGVKKENLRQRLILINI